MFGFVKRVFVSVMIVFGCNLSSLNLLECFSMNNQECKVKPKIVNFNSDEPVFFLFSVRASNRSGICNNIHKSDAKFCVYDVAKNLNSEVFNLISRTNETRHTEWHGTCKCKCRLDASVCSNKHCWNEDK